MAKSKQKGKAGELEFLSKLGDLLGTQLTRNLNQTANGGADCIDLPAFAIEVKRCEALRIPAWWQQALRQAGKEKIPVLAYRQSRQPWLIVVPLELFTGQDCDRGNTATVTVERFAQVAKGYVHDCLQAS